ncbi:caspase-8 [Acanthopagrus latus]|uniref:caspase-8 n=1 Tax=Acanthopagrus latus TaxID=8177 RepID=UPI00187C2514|nr:caspase-8 [Acanthopagrus latus]
MNFQKLLLEVANELSKDEVKALAFLCTDLLGRNPASVESANDLFALLKDRDELSAERPHLLTELLHIIQRPRLVHQLNLPDNATANVISPYRKLLYSLSEELSKKDLNDMKFLLNENLPRKKLEDVTTLEVFLELEHKDLINETNLELLETTLQSICPMLLAKIHQYKALQETHRGPVAQETSRPRSNTYPSEEKQVPESRVRTFTNEIPGLPPLPESNLNYSNISMDVPNTLHSGDEFDALSRGVRGLSTATVRSDASAMSPQEHEMSSGELRSPTATTSTDLETYPMTAATRGICLIINNYDFTNSRKTLSKREGTQFDLKCLQTVFTWLRFEIETHQDCTSEKMLSVMRDLSSRDHSQMDCLVCFILSHGIEGSVYGVDGNTVTIQELMELFSGLNCSSLLQKPKMFFIQACQGNDEQKPVFIESDGPSRGSVHSDAVAVKDSIPSVADFLLGMATVPSFVSFRERSNGTWFIQSFCQNLVTMVPRSSDILTILTKVNADVSRKTDSRGMKKQMPQPTFSLTKKVVFPIPTVPPPNLLR